MKTPFYSIRKIVKHFLRKQHQELSSIDFIVGVSRGGLIPATLIATGIDKPLISVYIDQQDNPYLDRGEWIRGKNILLVDDIVRTGKTFQLMMNLIQEQNPKSISSFTLFCLEDASIKPTWTKMTAKDKIMPWD